MLALYGLTIFVSAALLFIVQPLFARMALPLLGGAPAVWNTALVFYQAVLLLGYGYAHLLTSRLTARRQVLVHLGVLLLPLFVLPISIPLGWIPPRSENPMGWLLGLLSIAVGLPFFAVSASSPLLQTWFSFANHRTSKDPYFLYAASNVGSMLALLSYPFLLEPAITLKMQSWLWAMGYGVLVLLMIGCGIVRWQSSAPNKPQITHSTTDSAPTMRQRLRWIALAAVPSSLMVSVTTFLSTDLASIPLLWILPLAIYLLTFIFVFAQRVIIPRWLMVRALPILVLPLIITIAVQANDPLIPLLIFHLVTFFVITMVAHGQLADERPATRYLTEFYLWMSLGGVIGGAFNALLAPLLFDSVAEYQITLVLACLLAPQWGTIPQRWKQRYWDFVFPIIVGIMLIASMSVYRWIGVADAGIGLTLVFVLPMLASFTVSRRPLRFGLSIASILVVNALINPLSQNQQISNIYAKRSFFGVNRVAYDAQEKKHILFHGSTIHGIQSLNEAQKNTPLSYYYPTGPAGEIFSIIKSDTRFKNIGVVGMGAGSLICYKQPNQEWTFYEIDPVVVEIAQNPEYFTFLRDCGPNTPIKLGDARLSLQEAPAHGYDIIVMDAYSSDSIPVHLITREALELYLNKLSEHGLIVFHISNRHLDLEPVLDNLARDSGLTARSNLQIDVLPAEAALGKQSSQWVVMARNETILAQLNLSEAWVPLINKPNTHVWTDDYSSIVQTLR